MSHKNKLSLIRQIEAAFKKCAQQGIGTSKHSDKEAQQAAGHNNITREKIYSWETFRSYLKQACYFGKYCKEIHGCKTIDECRKYVNEWLQKNIDKGLSASTIKLRAAAIAKLYGCSTTEFIKTPSRCRKDIKKSRGAAVRDSHFSKKNNAALISFCRSTGLRRRELQSLTGDKLVFLAGKPFIYITNGKGGRKRFAPVIGQIGLVERIMKQAGHNRVFDTLPGAADIHSFRADYATAMYKMYARPLETLSRKQKYYCRGDLKGVVLDRRAMLITSKALGHNRLSVIAGHYIRIARL